MGDIDLLHVSTNDHVADIFTLNKLQTFSVAVGLQNLDALTLRGSTMNICNDRDRDR